MVNSYRENNNVGWTCPVCGQGKAPWVQSCNCRPANTSRETETEDSSVKFVPLPMITNRVRPDSNYTVIGSTMEYPHDNVPNPTA